jgi:hypothetical protein
LARDFDSVAECYTANDLGQLILSLQAPPTFRSRHDQLENHESRRVLRQCAFHANRAMPNRCEGAFDRIRRSKMRPVLRGEIEERQQRIAILEQAIDRLVVFGRIFLGEDRHRGFGGRAVLGQPDFAQIPMGVGLNRLRQLVENVQTLVLPPRCPARSTDPAPSDRQAVPSSSDRFPACPSATPEAPSCPPASRQSEPTCIRPAAPCAPADRRRPPRHKHSAGPTDRGLASADSRPPSRS